MRIGVDLDNTIVCYDGLFHSLALERGWIRNDTASSKGAVRDAVRRLSDGDDKWQELQAEAYGPRLSSAKLFPGVEAAFRAWREQGHEVFILSHKTRFSGKGGHDLHRAALAFLRESPLNREGLLADERIMFCDTRAEKIRRITDTGCAIFIDDLLEFFSEPDFPRQVRKLHFAPDVRTVSPPDALICRSWWEIAAYDPEVDHLLEQVTGSMPRRLEKLSGGRNSRVWKCEPATGLPVALKRYPCDGRNRLGVESSAFTLLQCCGLSCVPNVLAVFPERNMAVYSWIAGEPVTSLGDAPEAVEPFVRLIEQLQLVGRSGGAANVPLAAEACASLFALREQVERRFAALLELHADSGAAEAMRLFVRRELVPEWKCRLDAAIQGYERLGRAPDRELAEEERVLSPSDFGCHNTIRTPNGELAFIDFEYFGWDDPVKLVSDFVLHPAMRLTEQQKQFFRQRVMGLFAADSDAPLRLPLLLPLFAIKWACILLNEFLPAENATRHFAAEAAPSEVVLERQLGKARMMLTSSRRS